MNDIKIHRLADVQSQNIGEFTEVWQFSVILKGAIIGKHCNINCHTFIENDVKIGDQVTVKSGVYLWDGMEIANNVFIGPNVTFVNDKYPKSKRHLYPFQKIKIEQFASIGAASTILGGVQIGEYALIAAGSVVTKSVPAFALMMGNPARIKGKVDNDGNVIERF